ncbi:MAG: hypothetical protein NVS4B3_22560 [Gemmatimonadaceae bacterium]
MNTASGGSGGASAPSIPASPQPKRPAAVHVRWAGEHRFDAGRLGGPTLRLDGSGVTGQSPVDGVLSALAACTSVDVVDILAKRRTPVSSLAVDAVGQRAEAMPARLTRIHLTYRIGGAGIEQAQAERAVELAVTKYCSVRDSLARDIIIDWTVLVGNAGTDGQ